MFSSIPPQSRPGHGNMVAVFALVASMTIGAPAGRAQTGETGACCLNSGPCRNLTASDCALAGGDFFGIGSVCGGRQACCLEDGGCVMLEPRCCLARGGRPQGQNTSCTQPRPCCLGNGVCVLLDPLCCAQIEGTVIDNPLSAEPPIDTCANPKRCCLEDRGCVKVDPLCCFEMGGTPTFGVCTPAQACCFQEGSCVDMDPQCCIESGGNPQGAGRTCLDTPCDSGAHGCTTGYWSNPTSFSNWPAPYRPEDLFGAIGTNGVVFSNAFPGKTLVEILGDTENAMTELGGRAVAALLNATSQGMNYPLTPLEVVNLFNEAAEGGDISGISTTLASFNQLGCPPSPPSSFSPLDPSTADLSDSTGQDPLGGGNRTGESRFAPQLCAAGAGTALPLMMLGWSWLRRRQDRLSE